MRWYWRRGAASVGVHKNTQIRHNPASSARDVLDVLDGDGGLDGAVGVVGFVAPWSCIVPRLERKGESCWMYDGGGGGGGE